MNVRTAPTKAKALTSSTGYYRRELDAASRAEQENTQGATERREFLTREFQQKCERAEAAIDDTTAAAQGFADAAAILDAPTAVKPRDRITRLARCGALLGIDAEKLAPSLRHAAGRATEAAQKAQVRMDAAAPDLEATALHALLLSKLPAHGFNAKSAALAPIRSAYQAAVTESRKRNRT